MVRQPKAAWLLTFGLVSGCNALLDIEPARVDERLTSDASHSAIGDDTEALGDDEVEPAAAGGLDAGRVFADASTEMPAVEDDIPVDAGQDVPAPNTPRGDSGTDAGETTAPSPTTGEDMPLDAGASTPDEEPEVLPEPALCEKYCDEIMELCTGALEQYRDLNQCLTVCELLPQGEITSEQNDNSVACRLRHASKARYAAGTEHEAYCRQAGPGGDGRCGSNCEGYCSLMAGVCTPEEAGIYRFATAGECMDACQELPTSPDAYSTANVEISDGDHVQCRLFHVTSAAMLDAEEHCEHAMGITLCEGQTAAD